MEITKIKILDYIRNAELQYKEDLVKRAEAVFQEDEEIELPDFVNKDVKVEVLNYISTTTFMLTMKNSTMSSPLTDYRRHFVKQMRKEDDVTAYMIKLAEESIEKSMTDEDRAERLKRVGY